MPRSLSLALLLTAASFAPICSLAQTSQKKLSKADGSIYNALQKHTAFLSSDALEGRRTGTDGERKASEYIAAQMQTAGLLPKGTQGYFQPFGVGEGRDYAPGSLFTLNGDVLKPETDFLVLPFSSEGSVEAMAAFALPEMGAPRFVDVKDVLESAAANPHGDLWDALYREAMNAKGNGASAVIFYNSGPANPALVWDAKKRMDAAPLPVVFLREHKSAPLTADATASHDLRLRVAFAPRVRTGRNVVGYLDNGAPYTVVLGAHYDHLGWGEDGNSMVRSGGPAIHNGADDNASGTAALLEIGRGLKATPGKGYNYLFIAFSGEELGLYGSKHWVDSPTVPLPSLAYMINMDMVGRLPDSTKTLTLGGYGTSPLWGATWALKGKKKPYTGTLQFRLDSSGTGPSDHSSFYRKDIPVLFYFTGLHTDYHKPSDDADRLNLRGEVEIVKHIQSLVLHTAATGSKPTFLKTREVQMGTSARFSVTMGIMPDYTFSGEGVRADGVSEGRPAQRAGLQAGDIIRSIGGHKTGSVEAYMQALSKFKKGDVVTVVYNRKGEEKTAQVTF